MSGTQKVSGATRSRKSQKWCKSHHDRLYWFLVRFLTKIDFWISVYSGNNFVDCLWEIFWWFKRRTSQEVPSITQGLCQFGDDIPENRQWGYVKPKQHLSSILPWHITLEVSPFTLRYARPAIKHTKCHNTEY